MSLYSQVSTAGGVSYFRCCREEKSQQTQLSDEGFYYQPILKVCDAHHYTGKLPCPWPECWPKNEYREFNCARLSRTPAATYPETTWDHIEFGKLSLYKRRHGISHGDDGSSRFFFWERQPYGSAL